MALSDVEKASSAEQMSKPPTASPQFHDVESGASVQDAVFGDLSKDGPNYRSVGWIGTAGLMMKTQMGLGVLSFPSVFNAVGMIPGIILLLVIGGMTTWSNYIVGVFKLNHREIYGVDDVGQLLFGRVGKEVLTFAYLGMYILATGSAMLSLSISFNALSNHGTCTATFVGVSFVLVFIVSSMRTLGDVKWIVWIGLVGIMVAVFMVTIAVGIQGGPPDVPVNVWVSDYQLFAQPTFTEAMSAIASLVFAYAGTGAFFPIVAEMRDPTQYTKALILCQTVISTVYVTVAIVVYYYCGSHVVSPALGSAGPLIKKIAYGIALPGLLASGCLLAHVSSKYIFVRILRGSKHLSSNSVTHWVSWLGCSFAVSFIAYIMASAVPVFNGLVGLAGSLFGTLLCFQPMGCMWLYDNWSRPARTWRWYCGVAWSVVMIIGGTFLMIGGTYSTIVEIIASARAGGSGVWSCADNSNSS